MVFGQNRSTLLPDQSTVTSALLGAASGLPLVGPLCQVVQGILGDVEEFSEKADDVLVAARRVIDVLDVVDLMSKNVSKCSDGKDIAQANMQRLIDLLKEFHAAVRAFADSHEARRHRDAATPEAAAPADGSEFLAALSGTLGTDAVAGFL